METEGTDTDFDLLDRWADGDQRAGNELFQRHFTAVLRFFRNKIDRNVEDLVQKTFMACVQGRERFRRESSFRTYLFATARNTLYAEYRRRQRKDAPVDFGTVSAVDLQPSPSEILVKKREQRLLLEALRTIPVDYQVALELYLWEDLSAPQMATILELKEPGVRSRLRRAKEALRERMLTLSAAGEKLDSTETDIEAWAVGLRDELGRG